MKELSKFVSWCFSDGPLWVFIAAVTIVFTLVMIAIIFVAWVCTVANSITPVVIVFGALLYCAYRKYKWGEL